MEKSGLKQLEFVAVSTPHPLTELSRQILQRTGLGNHITQETFVLASRSARHSRIVSATLALLFTCSGVCVSAAGALAAGSGIVLRNVVTGSGPWLTPGSFLILEALGKPLLFAAGPSSSNGSGNFIDIFVQGSNTRVGQISDRYLNGPIGVATDVSGNLYVANNNAPTVPVYAPPYTKGPTRVLETPGYLPQGVAVSSAGIVAVANFCNRANCNEFYDVSFYAKGATRPCKTIPLAANAIAGRISFDSAGDAFVAGQIFSTELPYIAEIEGGCEAKTVKPLTAKNKLGQIFEVHVNKQDKVALLDADAGKIYTYDLPVKGSLGDPVATTAAPNVFDFAFVASGLDLYATILMVHSSNITEFSYPGGRVGKSFNTPKFYNGGVAVWPPLVP